MPFEICPVQRSDVEATTKVLFSAYKDDPVSKVMNPGGVTPSIISWVVNNTLKSWGKGPLSRRMQVRDTQSGEILSFSQWYFFPERRGDHWKKMPEMEWPDEYNQEVATTMQVTHITKRNEIMGEKAYICKSTSVTIWSHPYFLLYFELSCSAEILAGNPNILCLLPLLSLVLSKKLLRSKPSLK